MKILANDGIDNSGKIALEKAGFEIITEKVAQENLAAEINKNNYVGVLVRSATTVRKEVIDDCPELKLIGRGGVGMDNIDVDYARSKGLAVINTPAASSQSVAELVFAHLFDMARFLYDSNKNMVVKGDSEFDILKKKYAKGIELRGKTIGIIGFGRIGQNTARYALGCGMNVIACDPFVKEATIYIDIQGIKSIPVPIKTCDFETIIKTSDFISLHVPKQADGRAVIGTEEIDKMKKGVCLVNAARGGVIDETALIEGLNSGKIAHAALDVFENEPTPSKLILTHPKISLTPHIGAATLEAQERIGEELAEKIISYLKSN